MHRENPRHIRWRSGALLVATVLISWGVGGSAQRARPQAKPSVAPKAQSIPPEIVFAAGEGPIGTLAFAPDGKTIACAENGHAVKIFAVPTGDLVRVLSEEAPISAVAYAPDGSLLASGAGRRGEPVNGVPTTNAVVRLWNPQTGKPEGPALEFPKAAIRRSLTILAFSPDGKSLAAGTGTLTSSAQQAGHQQVGELTVWDVPTRKVRFHIAVHERQTDALAFSPDSRLLASGGADGVMKIWDPITGELKQTLKPPTAASGIECVGFFPDGKRVAASGRFGGADNVWDAETGTLIRRNFGGGYNRFVLLDNGKTAVFNGSNGLIMMDVETNRPTVRLGSPYVGPGGNALAVTVDGKTLAASAAGGEIRFWNVEAGKDRGRAIGGIPGAGSDTMTVSVSPDGGLLALGGGSGVRLWDTRRATLRHLLVGPYPSTMNHTAFSPDGSLLVAATYSAGVQMWETQGGLRLHVFSMTDPTTPDNSYLGTAFEIAFSPDGRRFAASGDNRIYRIWNRTTFAQEHTLVTPGVPTYALDFSPDSQLLATGDMLQQQERTNTIRLWDLNTGTVRSVLNDPRDAGRNSRFMPPHIRYIPRTSLLASWAFNDTALLLWNTTAGTVSKQLETGPEGVTGLAVSADGSRLAVTTIHGSISLWDVATGKKLRQWRGHDLQAMEPAFSPDGKTLYTTSLDHTVKFWSVSDGMLRGTLRFFSGQDSRIANAWIFTTPEGHYTCSTGAEALIRWRVNGQLYPASRFPQERKK